MDVALAPPMIHHGRTPDSLSHCVARPFSRARSELAEANVGCPHSMPCAFWSQHTDLFQIPTKNKKQPVPGSLHFRGRTRAIPRAKVLPAAWFSGCRFLCSRRSKVITFALVSHAASWHLNTEPPATQQTQSIACRGADARIDKGRAAHSAPRVTLDWPGDRLCLHPT